MTDNDDNSTPPNPADNDNSSDPAGNDDDHKSGNNFASHSSRSDGEMLAPSLRILCLHDGNSNAGELSDQLEVLGERLYEKHMIDLVYVNAPLLVQGLDNANDNNTAYYLNPLNNNPQRVWWEEQEPQPQPQPQQVGDGDERTEASGIQQLSSSSEEVSSPAVGGETTTILSPSTGNQSKNFVGLDASLLLLRQIWNSMPFWGVLAVGQGAAAASFLPLLPVSPPPQFMIFVRGESLLDETDFLVGNALSKSCLHLMEATPSESSERLLQQFGGRVFTGVTRNFTTRTLNVIGKVSRTTVLQRLQSGDDWRVSISPKVYVCVYNELMRNVISLSLCLHCSSWWSKRNTFERPTWKRGIF